MHVEREQRWLLPELPDGLTDPASIVDRYLIGTRLRLRSVTTVGATTYKLGQKVRPEPDSPAIVKLTNIYLSGEEYGVLRALPGRDLRKARWRSAHAAGRLVVDEFSDPLTGLVLGELELRPGEAPTQLDMTAGSPAAASLVSRPPTPPHSLRRSTPCFARSRPHLHAEWVHDLTTAAARNNAEWCDLVCRSHALPASVERNVWAAHRRSPPLYPDAVTLAPSASVDAILDRVDGGDGCSVKDCFVSVDLDGHGFRVLFGAEWIYRFHPSTTVDGLVWSPAQPLELSEVWNEALVPSLLAEPSVVVLVARAGEEIVGGVIANRSHDVVGLSNLVIRAADRDEVWAGAVAAISASFRVLHSSTTSPATT